MQTTSSSASVNSAAPWDVLIANALVFDGSGSLPVMEDVAIADGRIVARGTNLDATQAAELVDASGRWLIPGMLDIHTHLDLEVEVNPGLHEAVRHGSTSVIVGNCSLGTSFGAQLRDGESPIIDCFTRVENMPKRVLQKCVDKLTWDNTADYLEHFKSIPLGPNIAPLVPHSMLRIEVMGIDAAVNRDPTAEEQARMEQLLDKALDEGYIGMSNDGIVFHYLSNDPNKEKRIPTQYASNEELEALVDRLRAKDRVWQTTPDAQKMDVTVKRFFWTSGRLHRKPLRVSALVALDFTHKPGMWRMMVLLSRLLNSFIYKGKFHFQALSTNFRMWATGAYIPVFEEIPSTRALIACEIDDREGRRVLLDDPEWQEGFRRDWLTVQPCTGLDKYKLTTKDRPAFEVNPEQIFIDPRCPVPPWHKLSLQSIFERFEAHRNGQASTDPSEAQLFNAAPASCDNMCEFFMLCLRELDTDFCWYLEVANEDPAVVKKLLFNPGTLPGFNDSGAHISNLAFYDGNLVTLKLAQQDGLKRVAHAVKRLTREPAAFFGLDVGGMALGDQADLVLINPDQLATYDTNANRQMAYHEAYEQEVLVNRSDGVVEQVYIKGTRVWEAASRFTDALGSKTLGRALTFSDRFRED